MSKEMIVSVNGREKKIAILDNGKVTEFYIERGEENSGIAGNIYKGRVQRVLPGMQSAFVGIGLERDAFLYVSDFFDEEEEIERIVMEKSRKSSPEEAKREAKEQIERARVDREKLMESAQEIMEPLADTETEAEASDDDAGAETPEPKGRGRRGRSEKAPIIEDPAQVLGDALGVDLTADEDQSQFERIVDDAETGEMFKEAFVEEAITDQVRSVEFDMEGSGVTEVGSILALAEHGPSGFERIADDDDVTEPSAADPEAATDDAAGTKAKGRGKKAPAKKPAARGKKAAAASEEAPTEAEIAEGDADEKPVKGSKAKAAKPKTTRSRAKKADESAEASSETLSDAEASVSAPSETAEMAVRRAGRGRRRGGRNKGKDSGNGTDTLDADETNIGEENGDEMASEAELEAAAAGDISLKGGSDDKVDAAAESEAADTADETEAAAAVEPAEEKRSNGRVRSNDRRGDRSERNERSDRNDRSDRAERSDREGGESRDKRSGAGDRNRKDNERGGRNERGDRKDRGGRSSTPTISDLLREGQEILVQIAKEPIAKKGARITSHIALPGRFLVYMPTIEHLGVSRRIESSSERGRLRGLIQRIRQEEDVPSGGFIVRTAGVGISEEDLRQDARYLVRTWQEIKRASEKAKSPAMVHQDLDLVQRLLRDQLSDDFTAIRVDSEEEYFRTVEFINRIQPRLVNRVKLYTRETPILEAYGVQEEIDKALKPRVWLRSGGYLVINQTEALVAIDVNTGKFVGKGNARLEDTITRTNMEAVDEIARQIRLRDLGGIIVLDLIDMEDRRNRHKVSQALQEALSHDKSPTKVLSFNDFGLIIMTRKRVKQSLERTMCAPCEYCEGAGWIKSPQTVCYEILAEARRLSKHEEDLRQTTLRVHPDVLLALRTTERAVLEEIEAYLTDVDLASDPTIHQAQFDFAFV